MDEINIGLIEDLFGIKTLSSEAYNFCAECESLPRKQKNGEWIRDKYYLFLTHPRGVNGVYKPIRLKSDGIKLERKRTADYPFSLKETQVTLTCYSETDRMYYPYSATIEGQPITLEIYRNNRDKLYYSGRLAPNQFHEPYSYKDGYFTDLTFSDFACLTEYRYTGEINLFKLLQEAVAFAFIGNIRKPSLVVAQGCADITTFEVKRSLWGYKEEVRMHDVVQGILKSFCLNMEQRDGSVWLYDRSALLKLPTEDLFPTSTDAKLETEEAKPRIKFKFKSPESVWLSDMLRDVLPNVTEYKRDIYRFDAEPIGIDFITQLEPRQDGSAYYRILPKEGAMYDYGIAVVFNTANGIQQWWLAQGLKDAEKPFTTANKATKEEDGNKYTMVTQSDFIQNGSDKSYIQTRTPFLDVTSDCISPFECNKLTAKINGEMLFSQATNHYHAEVIKSIMDKFTYVEGSDVLTMLRHFENIKDSEKGGGENDHYMHFHWTEAYLAADITLCDSAGKALYSLYNLEWLEPYATNPLPPMNKHDNGRFWREILFVPKSTDKEYRNKESGFLWSSRKNIKGHVGAIEPKPKWTSDVTNNKYHLFIRVGDCFQTEGIDITAWNRLNSFSYDKDEDKGVFTFSLPSVPLFDNQVAVGLPQNGKFYIRLKLYPYIIPSFKQIEKEDKKRSVIYNVKFPADDLSGSKIQYKLRKILYRCNDKPIIELIPSNYRDKKKGNEENNDAEAKGWIKDKKGKAGYEEEEIPLMLDNRYFYPLIEGYTHSGHYLGMGTLLNEEGLPRIQPQRLLEEWMALYGKRRPRIRGSYAPIDQLCTIAPPDNKRRAFFIEEETTDLLKNTSEIEMIGLPKDKVKGEREKGGFDL